MEQDRHRDTEVLRKQDSTYCDSVFWVGQKERKGLIFENEAQRKKLDKRPLIITLVGVLGLIVGLVLGQ